MKIIFFGHETNVSGAEKTLYEFISELISISSHEIVLVLPNKKGSMFREYQKLPIKIEIISYTWAVRPVETDISVYHKFFNLLHFFINSIIYTNRVFKYLKEEKPQIVITNTVAVPWAAFACRIIGIDHIWVVREDFQLNGTIVSHSKFFYNYKTLFNLSKYVLMPSAEVLHRWKLNEIEFSKARIIYSNPYPKVKIDFRAKPIKDVRKAIWVGTYNHNKNPQLLLREIKLNFQKLKNWHFSFFGHGPLYEDLKNFVAESKLESQVSINVHFQSLEQFYREADVSISTSINEAFGRSLAEAAKFGAIPIYPCGSSWEERFNPGLDSVCFETNTRGSISSVLNKLENKIYYVNLRNKLYEHIQLNYNLEKPETTLVKVIENS